MNHNRKHDYKFIAGVIDEYWRAHAEPPSLSEIGNLVGIESKSHVHYVVRQIPGVRISRHGKVIPAWVDDAVRG